MHASNAAETLRRWTAEARYAAVPMAVRATTRPKASQIRLTYIYVLYVAVARVLVKIGATSGVAKFIRGQGQDWGPLFLPCSRV